MPRKFALVANLQSSSRRETWSNYAYTLYHGEDQHRSPLNPRKQTLCRTENCHAGITNTPSYPPGNRLETPVRAGS